MTRNVDRGTRRAGTAAAMLALGLLFPGTARAGGTPTISAVHFSRIGQNLHIEVDGAGFGLAPYPLPAVGALNQFGLTNLSRGGWLAGHYGNSVAQLQFTSWTDARIVVDGFGPGYGGEHVVSPGDKVSLFVQNTAAGGGTANWSGVLDAAPPPPLNPGGPSPQVASVHFSRIGENLHIEVDGAGFGLAPYSLPAVGALNQFELKDLSQGGWTAGHYGNSVAQLQFTSWTDTRIVVDGFGPGYGGEHVVTPGDQVSIFVQHSGGPEYTVWTGTLDPVLPPPLDPGGATPQIAAVQFSKIGQGLHIEVEGAGFGTSPYPLPAVGALNQFQLKDLSQGGWLAGHYGNSAAQLQFTSWTDTRIVIDGFGPGYGGQHVVSQGDQVSIFVQHSGGPEYTVWTGPLLPGRQFEPAQLTAPTPGAVVKGGSVHFAWTPVVGAASYYLQAYLVQVGPGGSLGASGPTNLSWQGSAPEYSLDASRLGKGTYRWRVAAVNRSGELILPGWTAESVVLIN